MAETGGIQGVHRARGNWRDAFLHRRKDEERPQRQRPVRSESDFDEKAMLAQDRAMIEQLQRRQPRESVRKKPPTPPKVSPYKFRLDTAPPSPSNESDQVHPATETISEPAVETGTDEAQGPPEPPEPEPPAPAAPVEVPDEVETKVEPPVTVVPKSGELFSASDIDSIMNSITGEETKVPASSTAKVTETRRDRRIASETEFSIPDRSKLRDQIRAMDSWLEDDVTHEQVKEGLRLRHDDVSLQEVMAKTGKASKVASEVASEAEVFSKLESAKSRSKAGEKLPANEMKDLAQRVKPMLPSMNLEQLVRALNLFSATGYEDYDLYLNILGEIPVQVRGISPELLTKCLRLLWRLRFNEETYLELFSMEAMNMIRAKKPPRCKVRRPAGPLEVKAAPKPALAPFSGRMLIQIGNCLTQLGAKHPSRFMDVYQEQIAIAIPTLSQEDCELVTPCLAASPLLPDALRRAFLERCAEVDAGAPLVLPEASAAPDIARYQQDAHLYRRRAKHFRNIFIIEASIRKETWAFFSSLPNEVRNYLDRVQERSKELKPQPLIFATEVAFVLDQLGVRTWSKMVGPLEVHLVANGAGEDEVVYECNEAEAYCAMRQEERTAQLTMATKFRHKLLQRLGIQLVHINYWEWRRLSEAQRINYMVKLHAGPS